MDNFRNPCIFAFGEYSLLIKWEAVISKDLLKYILKVKSHIQQEMEVQVFSTYNELLVQYPFPVKELEQKKEALYTLVQNIPTNAETLASLYHIPVCYDKKYGIDIELVCKMNKLELKELIRLHTTPIYTIYFIGFLPGFIYLGGLADKLFIDRKAQPRKRIAKGAVGLAGLQTGIYPKSSPAGWQIIGNCPLQLFDSNKNPPTIYKAGDGIKFYEVSWKEHREISARINSGEFVLKKSKYVY